ncbi:ADP-ribose pyrophosphatase [Vibrio stylophorae]|uniref:ADP-ribose pyrophosphatase n=1 Tax=Vibrio stylophorae TaxID=659351 RepID=A0ABM8ZVN2_9VIBR|nr:ADP-ribose diphosphatase [Vibrio stylophorae]CAH0534388.1 ADP-ribose pyrophosphatase [Vibrio stylophorae]
MSCHMSALQDEQFYSNHDVEIIQKSRHYNGFLKIDHYQFRHRLFAGGWSDPIVRECLERGDAAALLPYDPIADTVVLIEQIRVGALGGEQPWQLEIVAGMIDKAESAEQVARRESEEEAGISIERSESICSYYPSSGGCTEKLYLFVGEVDSTKAQGIHGLAEENEDIRVHVVAREQALKWLQNGRIENAASIIALQWLALNHARLRQQWQV